MTLQIDNEGRLRMVCDECHKPAARSLPNSRTARASLVEQMKQQGWRVFRRPMDTGFSHSCPACLRDWKQRTGRLEL